MARVLLWAEVIPGPAIKSALLDARHVIGDKVIAELVALIYARPEGAGRGLNGEPHGVADARGIELLVLSVGRERENAGAAILRVVVVDVRARADRHKHPLVV